MNLTIQVGPTFEGRSQPVLYLGEDAIFYGRREKGTRNQAVHATERLFGPLQWSEHDGNRIADLRPEHGVRVVLVVKEVQPGQWQCQIRQAAGGHCLFNTVRRARVRDVQIFAERVWPNLRWQDPPAALQHSEPEVRLVAYLNF